MFIRIKKNGKWGYFNSANGTTIACDYYDAKDFTGGYAIVQSYRNNRHYWGVINESGKYVIKPRYDSIEFYGDDVFKVELFNHIGLWDVVSECFLGLNSQPLSEAYQKYDLAIELDSELVLVIQDKRGASKTKFDAGWPITNECRLFFHEKEIIGDFTNVFPFNETFLLFTKNSFRFGLMKKDGCVVIEPDYVSFSFISNNLVLACYGSCDVFDISKDKAPKICTISGTVSLYKDTIYKITNKSSQKSFYADLSKGEVVFLTEKHPDKTLQLIYDYYGPYENGYIEVSSNGKYGAIDSNGALVVPCEYDALEYKEGEGFVILRKDKKNIDIIGEIYGHEFGIYDPQKKTIILDCKYQSITPLVNGYSLVSESFTKTGVINRDGVFTIRLDYHSSIELTQDPSVVLVSGDYYCKLSGERVFKNKRGEYIPLPNGTRVCSGIQTEGITIIQGIDDVYSKKGAINDDGQIVIPLLFDDQFDIQPFKGAVATINLLQRLPHSFSSYRQTRYYCRINANGSFVLHYRGGIVEIKASPILFVFDFEGDVARAFNGDKWGLISPDGKTIAPFLYDWIFPFRNHLAFVTVKETCGLINDKGEEIIIPQYHNLRQIGKSSFSSKEGSFTIESVIDGFPQNGSNINEPFITAELSYFYTSDGRKGLKNKDGEIVLCGPYASIERLPNGWWRMSRDAVKCLDSKHGLIENDSVIALSDGLLLLTNGNTILSRNYQWWSRLTDGLSIVEDTTGMLGVINNDGKEIIPCQFDKIELLNGDRYIQCVRKALVDYSEITLTRVFNLDGGSVILSQTDNQDYEISFDYDSSGQFGENGLAPIMIGGLWGFVNEKSKIIIPCVFQSVEPFIEGMSIVRLKKEWESYYAVIDESGSYLIPPFNYRNLIHCRSLSLYGEAFDVSMPQESEMIKMNRNGQLLYWLNNQPVYLDKQIRWYHVLENGDIQVFNGVSWGLYGSTLNEIIPLQYSAPFYFKDGFAEVRLDNKVGVIDRKGRLIIRLAYEHVHYDSVNGLFIAVVSSEKNFKTYECLSVDGERLFVKQAKSLRAVSRCHFIIDLTDDFYPLMGIINKNGDILCSGLSDVQDGHDGMVMVREKEFWGYFDLDNNTLIKCEYSKATPFYNGIALVCISGRRGLNEYDKWGAINKKGETIVPFKYLSLSFDKDSDYLYAKYLFSYGRFNQVIRTKLDYSGNPISSENDDYISFPGYDASGDFHNGFANVYGEDGVGLIDSNNRIVIPCKNYDFPVLIPGYQDGRFVVKYQNDYEITTSELSFLCSSKEKSLVPEVLKKIKLNCDLPRDREIDDKGRIIIDNNGGLIHLPFEYSYAGEWEGDYFRVLRNGKWGIMNNKEELVIDCCFEYIYGFDDSVAIGLQYDYSVKSWEIHLLNMNKGEIRRLHFDGCYGFNSGVAVVIKKKALGSWGYSLRYGLIDKSGEIILPCEYDYIPILDDLIYEEFEERQKKMSEYDGGYSQDELDKMYLDAFDGDPSNIWNID
jgi:hypothetical protein